MLLVVALGGNALLERGQPPDIDTQRANIRMAIESLAELANDNALVVTHGNGPQVGLLAVQSESVPGVPAHPLDVLDAETEGMLGYLIEQEIANRLPARQVAALLTRVEVAADDPAFEAPSKPIGPIYDSVRARELVDQRGWRMGVEGTGFRRLVASPAPRRILELSTIRALVEAGHIVVCAGGGGIPVVLDADGLMRGVEAVIDKDAASALLGSSIGAEGLMLLTDEPAVWSAWPRENGRAIRRASPSALGRFDFAPGSMGPKVDAACRFVLDTGRTAAIGALKDACRIIAGEAGTTIAPEADLELWDDPTAST